MKIPALNIIKNLCGILILGIFAVSCNQDPIFFIISTETAPIPPRIEGAPTNIVVFEREYPGGSGTFIPILYVASGKLHWYAPASAPDKPAWDLKRYHIPQPKGKIIALAVAGERMYALCLDSHGTDATLRSIGRSDNKWKKAAASDQIQSIHADPAKEILFAGIRKNSSRSSNFSIKYLDNDTNTLKMLKDETSMLTGAVYRGDSYYLCTRGGGIFQVNEQNINENNMAENAVTPLGDSKLMIMGMIKLKDDSIIAIEREKGVLHQVLQDGSVERVRSNSGDLTTGKYATGALALWRDYLNPDKQLLVAGIQGGLYSTSTSSYTHGYVEFELDSSGSFTPDSRRHDSSKLQSVSNTDRYTTSLGKHPINHLFQTPETIDTKMTFFASTQTAGLWSYRNRSKNGGWQWNAEE